MSIVEKVRKIVEIEKISGNVIAECGAGVVGNDASLLASELVEKELEGVADRRAVEGVA